MDFFDREAKKYINPYIELFFLNWLKDQRKSNDEYFLLDIGGGNGIFSKEVLKIHPQSSTIIIDPSSAMLELVNEPRIETVKGALPDQLNYRKIVDYIHISMVLHHIVGSSPSKSLELMARSLKSAYNLLKPGGILMLREECWESRVHTTFARDALFYTLKMQNFIGVKIPHKYFLIGLEVCFLSQHEVEKMLEKTGFSIIRKNTFNCELELILKAIGVESIVNVDWIAQKPS